MKHALSFIGGAVLAILLFVYLYPEPKSGNGHGIMTTDTIVKCDTIAYRLPVPTMPTGQLVGTVEVRVPTGCIKTGNAAQPPIRADTDTTKGNSENLVTNGSDSATIELPVTQSVYESTDYKAYVSGVHAQLDSIFVYPKHEIVTIKEKQPPKRWHIGVTTGYGVGRTGLQPYLGIGLTYSLFSF